MTTKIVSFNDAASPGSRLPAAVNAEIGVAITAAVNTLLNGAPGALDTLKELADALGDDANFAATVASALAGKQPSDATLTALAGVTTAADRLIYATASDTFTTTPFTAAGRALIDDADAAAQRVTLALGNVDNISDVNKPVSTAQASAIAATSSRLDSLGQADLIKSVTSHRYDWEDTNPASVNAYASTPLVTEEWADLTAWTSAALQVSSGSLYNNSSSTGSVRTYAIPDGARARIRTVITVPATGSGSGFGAALCMVGVSNGAVGVAPSGNNGFMIGIDPGTLRPMYWQGSAVGGASSVVSLSATPLTGGVTYDVTVVVDELSISLSLTSPDGLIEFVQRVARTSMTGLSNLVLWNTDPRNLTGLGIGRIAARAASPTILPRISAAAVAGSTVSLNDSWPDLSGWTSGSHQVSSGKVYHNAAIGGGTQYGLAHAISSTGLLSVNVSVPLTAPAVSGGAGWVLIGLAKGAVSSTVTTANLALIGIDTASGKLTKFWGSAVGGTDTFTSSAAAAQVGIHTVTITSTTTNWVLTVTAPDGTTAYTFSVPRSGLTPTQVVIFHADPRDLTGVGVGAITASLTYTPTSGVYEGRTNTSAYVKPSSASTAMGLVRLPASYDSRRPYPLIISCHGHGVDALTGLSAAPYIWSYWQTIVSAGYILATSDAQGSYGWGYPGSVNDYEYLYRYVRDHYAISSVVVIGQSMGGLPAANLIARRSVPNILGYYGLAPCSSLRAMYDANYGGTFQGEIKTIYGIASDGSDYAAKTAGSDPMLDTALAFRGIPVRMSLVLDDAVVPPADHGLPLLAKIAGTASEASSFQTTTGGHIAAAAFDTADVLSFLARVTTA